VLGGTNKPVRLLRESQAHVSASFVKDVLASEEYVAKLAAGGSGDGQRSALAEEEALKLAGTSHQLIQLCDERGVLPDTTDDPLAAQSMRTRLIADSLIEKFAVDQELPLHRGSKVPETKDPLMSFLSMLDQTKD
jgi:hypothetical protein